MTHGDAWEESSGRQGLYSLIAAAGNPKGGVVVVVVGVGVVVVVVVAEEMEAYKGRLPILQFIYSSCYCC